MWAKPKDITTLCAILIDEYRHMNKCIKIVRPVLKGISHLPIIITRGKIVIPVSKGSVTYQLLSLELEFA